MCEVNCMNCIVGRFKDSLCPKEFCEKFKCAGESDGFIKHVLEVESKHGTCKTCKHYVPYKDQFSNRPRGDGYCNSNITTLDGNAFINCHDKWYCANYEKEGDKE